MSAHRHHFIRTLSAAGVAAFTVPGVFAQQLARTTTITTDCPFYPDKMPLDTDNDLLILHDAISPGVGEAEEFQDGPAKRLGRPQNGRR